MKKILLLLTIFPFFLACSSDDENIEKEPEGEKVAVTEQDILGGWEYIEKHETHELRHYLAFNTNDINSHYIKYINDEVIRHRYFKFTIEGLTMKLVGGAIATDIPMTETEIFKRGDKLYFNNMPFAPYKP